MRTSERATCTRLRCQGKFVHIESDEASTDDADVGTTLGGFTADETTDEDDDDEVERKRIYVPAMNAERTNDGIEDDESDEADADPDGKDVFRQELLRDFAEATDADTDDVGQVR